ncbi:MAG: hypothetical protein HYU02_04015 [Thaumarchaeota archaeon]|nr:hypothetical protein [Nitrososphaerota archaeon]
MTIFRAKEAQHLVGTFLNGHMKTGEVLERSKKNKMHKVCLNYDGPTLKFPES